MKPALRVALPFVGAMLIAAGLWVACFGLPNFSPPELNFEKILETKPGEPGFPDITAHYAIQGVAKYLVTQGNASSLTLNSVQYRKNTDEPRRAILYLPDHVSAQAVPEIQSLRHDLWTEAASAINQHADQNALFLSWWDNAQRIDLLTGQATWASLPIAAAFTRANEQALWQQLAGSFDKNETPLRQLATWLTTDAKQAKQLMAAALPVTATIYLLVCLDDLARINEIESLSGKKLGFEAKLFPQSGDIHGQINAVKSWANESGTGSYFVQTVPGQGIRAWRILDAATENTLLAKMLPFTSSLANPLEKLEVVYQSHWGAYLTIYQWLP